MCPVSREHSILNTDPSLELLPFAEHVRDQCGDGLHRGRFVGAIGFHRDERTFGSGKHHHAHDAFGIHSAAVAAYPNFQNVLPNNLCQLGRGSDVQPEPVNDFNFLLQHDAE